MMNTNWQTAVSIYMNVLENPSASESAKEGARADILKLAAAVDEQQKAEKADGCPMCAGDAATLGVMHYTIRESHDGFYEMRQNGRRLAQRWPERDEARGYLERIMSGSIVMKDLEEAAKAERIDKIHNVSRCILQLVPEYNKVNIDDKGTITGRLLKEGRWQVCGHLDEYHHDGLPIN